MSKPEPLDETVQKQAHISQTSSITDFPSVTKGELTTLLQLSPDALVVVDDRGKIILVNRQMESLFGYSSNELASQPLECLLPERLRSAHVAHRQHYMATPHTRPMGVGLELVGRRKDSSEFPVDISLRPFLVEQTLYIVGAIRDVTAQRMLERERLKQAEQLKQQHALINLAHDAILVRDPINRIISWNRGAEEMYGWSEQEALGRVVHTFLKTRFSAAQSTIEAQLLREGRWEGELLHTTRQGQAVIVESRQVVIRDEKGEPSAFLEINRDITRRRQLEQAQNTMHAATLAQRTFLQQMLDALPGSVYVVHGHDARLVVANRGATTIWGAVWPLEQPMQAFLDQQQISIIDTQGKPCPPESWATMRALVHHETVLQHQEVIRQPSGAHLPILVNAVPLYSPHWHSLGTQEQSEQQAQTTEPEPLALVIHQDVRMLKEAEYIKDEFIGIAAHELRLPLSVLKGAVGTLSLQTARGHGPQLADWQQEMLQEIEVATNRMAELTEDLLDVSRLQAGQLFFHPVLTNIPPLLHRVADLLQRTTTRHHLVVHSSHPTLKISIDPQRLEQVITNLLTNAIKYSPLGGPVTVTLQVDDTTRTLEIQIQDAGMGIPEHQQSLIFGRFVRADNAQAAGISGTGLGLYLCRALIEQQGGQIWFTSVEGKGTTFFITLPLPEASSLLSEN